MSLIHRTRTLFALGVVVMMGVLTLAGCGGGGSGTGNSGGGHTAKKTIVVGSKKDGDSQLLASMYALLLQQAGYTVQVKIPTGDTNTTFAAIRNGSIDVYPEFTGTALSLANLQTTHNPQQDFAAIKQAYEKQYQITWLDPAYNLNDGYAICTSQAVASQYNLHTIDDLKNVASKLTLSAQSDATQPFIQPLEQAYGITFGNIKPEDEQLSFQSVQNGSAQLNICYTTAPQISQDNFVMLTDTKNIFPTYNPAPIVRDDILSADSGITNALTPLESKLTTANITPLINELSANTTTNPGTLAKQFLQQQGLLK